MFDPATKIWFQRVEGQLKKALNAGDRPFLGLYADNFKDNARQYFRKKLITFTNPFNAYIQGLQRWPAVFATYLTIHVVEEYGRTGNHAVHPYVERAVTGGNTYHLTQAERERLWKSYRSACLYLGLSVSVRQAGTNYIIEEYLRQTGVPTQYVPELTRRMIHYSQDAGLPEDDDPAAIKLWQQGLLERFRTGISITVPRAIVADDIGYYVRLFLRILSAPNQIEPEATRLPTTSNLL